MSESICQIAVQRIQTTHRFLCQMTENLTEAQFIWVPGPLAPPIGWHLWHVARWADRLQASFPTDGGDVGRQIWEVEQFAKTGN